LAWSGSVARPVKSGKIAALGRIMTALPGGVKVGGQLMALAPSQLPRALESAALGYFYGAFVIAQSLQLCLGHSPGSW
jgi:hypothetical protein